MKKMFLAILAILVVAGLSFGAWQYLEAGQDKPNQDKQNTASDPSEGGKFLVINEWSVRVSYEVLGTDKARYNLLDDSRLYFYVEGLQEQVNQLSEEDRAIFDKCIQYPTRLIIRVNNSEASTSPFDNYTKHPIKSINGYGYLVAPPQAVCPDQEDSPGVARLINDYVLTPFKERRVDIITALESVDM